MHCTSNDFSSTEPQPTTLYRSHSQLLEARGWQVRGYLKIGILKSPTCNKGAKFTWHTHFKLFSWYLSSSVSLSLPLIPQWCCCGILFYLCIRSPLYNVVLNLYAFVSPCWTQSNQFWKLSHFVHTVKVTGFPCIYNSCWNILQNILCVPGRMYPFKGWALLYLFHSDLYGDLFPLNWDWNVFHVNRVSLHSQRVYTRYMHTHLYVLALFQHLLSCLTFFPKFRMTLTCS